MNQPYSNPLAWIETELTALEAANLRRRRVTCTGPQAVTLSVKGRRLVNFASNDYLALAADPRLSQAAVEAARQSGWGAGASPLISGHLHWHERLEAGLAEFEGTEAALVFSSGFAANMGTICALVGRGDAVFGDELNHASLIDGCRLSRAEVLVYPHGDVARLDEMLRSATGFRRRLIVTDTLFSMDGDLAPLAQLAGLAERHQSMLLIDEAHATGVFGGSGRGVAEHAGVDSPGIVRVGTLSKALGCSGGFVAGSRALIEWLVNRARSYMFSTSCPPANAAAALAALEIVQSEPQRRNELLSGAERLRMALREQGWNIGASASHIIPLIVGDSRQALELSARLRERGYWVPAIRPPSVPAGKALLRVSLSWGHTPEMIDGLLAALAGAR
jgi:8-amino-7-oxononanoate synthase